MFGASRDALVSLRSGLEAMRAEAGFAAVAQDLRAVSDLLENEKSLRLALSDSGRSTKTRVDIANDVLTGKISPLALQLVDKAVAQRWSNPNDLVDVLQTVADSVSFMAAQDSGELDQVEDELFQIERTLAESAQLQSALTNPAVEPNVKAAILQQLFAGRVTPITAEMVEFALSHLRGRRSDEVLKGLQSLAAQERNRLVAQVRVARPIQSDQVALIAERLSQAKGQNIRVNVIVDPFVLGGVHVTLAGEVIDGTIATRLDQARRVVAG
jgi:F-type H+-transporting ATPase subunit delta